MKGYVIGLEEQGKEIEQYWSEDNTLTTEVDNAMFFTDLKECRSVASRVQTRYLELEPRSLVAEYTVVVVE